MRLGATARMQCAEQVFPYLFESEAPPVPVFCGRTLSLLTPVCRLDSATDITCGMFNNCFADYAPRSALTMLKLPKGSRTEG